MSETGKICRKCSRPIHRSISDVEFASGHAPVVSLKIRLAAEWCPTPDCHQRVKCWNVYGRERGEFTDEVVRVRDLLGPIADGQIKRGCRVSQYDAEPGLRKTTLKDAREIAKRCVARINTAVNKFNEEIF